MEVTKRLKPSERVSRIGEPRLPLWVKTRRTGASPGRSAPGGEADEIGGRADIDTRMSAVGGRADVLATWPETPLLKAQLMALDDR